MTGGLEIIRRNLAQFNQKIADAIVSGLGPRLALPAVSLPTMLICAVGVFIDVSVITVAPVAKSRLPVGSSASSTAGRTTKARASATRCCSPPESTLG